VKSTKTLSYGLEWTNSMTKTAYYPSIYYVL